MILADCVRECRARALGRFSSSASEAACGLREGVEEFAVRISSFGGDRGDSIDSLDPETMLAGGRSSGLLSSSSGIVSLDKGLVALPELLVDADVGDLILDEVVGLEVEVVDVRVFEGLIGVMRDDVVAVVGRLGGADAALPKVVRRVLSVLGSVLDARELAVPKVDVLAGRLFSSPSAVAPSSLLLPAGFLTDEVVGLVGGLEMVLPDVREDSVLVRPVVGVVAVLEEVLSLEDAVVGFLESSVVGFAGAFAPVVLLSILRLHACSHQSFS